MKAVVCARAKRGAALKPFPFIVGVGRSGTTLLRLMVDANPDIAIPAEAHWLMSTIKLLSSQDFDADRVLRHLHGQPTWHDMHIADDCVLEILGDHRSPGQTIRCIYKCYANRHGATRGGDKTPLHGLWMPSIAKVLPEAHFIHIIRDGRDVAVSYRGMRFGPGSDAATAAEFWKSRVETMRRQGEVMPHYMEVRYESLVEEPETILRQIGSFIDLPFHPRQIEAHRYAAERLSEITDATRNDRTLTASQRREVHYNTDKQPDKTRIGRWKDAMTAEEVQAFEAVAGDLLSSLGYR